MELKWNTTEVNKFLRQYLPRLFEYFTTATNSTYTNHRGSSTLLTIWPYAVVTRKGKQLTVVNEFHPTGQTLRDALHNGGESLQRAINIRTIYLGTPDCRDVLSPSLSYISVTRDPIPRPILQVMFTKNPSACPNVQYHASPSDGMLVGPSNKSWKGKQVKRGKHSLKVFPMSNFHLS